VKCHARLRQLREPDRHVDVRGREVGPPAAAVAVAVVDEPAEIEPPVEILLVGDALAERERTLKLRRAHSRSRNEQNENDSNDSNDPNLSNDHAFRNALSSAST
jgi:hypothetical protein